LVGWAAAAGLAGAAGVVGGTTVGGVFGPHAASRTPAAAPAARKRRRLLCMRDSFLMSVGARCPPARFAAQALSGLGTLPSRAPWEMPGATPVGRCAPCPPDPRRAGTRRAGHSAFGATALALALGQQFVDLRQDR